MDLFFISYSSSGTGKIAKPNDIELIDMTPQTIVEAEKSFQTESQTNFENRRVRYSRHILTKYYILNNRVRNIQFLKIELGKQFLGRL